MRDVNGRNDPQLKLLLDATLKLQLKPLPHRKANHWSIKFRSSGFEIADLINQANPHTKNIFLYRNAKDQTRSAISAFDLQAIASKKLNGAILQRWLKLVPHLKRYKWKAQWRGLDRIDLTVLAWLSRMERYLTLYNQDAEICAIKYEDLISDPETVVKAIFNYTNFPESLAPQTLHVFQRDSQAGSSLARQKVHTPRHTALDPKYATQIDKYLKAHPIINSASFQLPNTLLQD